MKWPLAIRWSRSAVSATEVSQKILIESFRVLGHLCSRLADVLEAEQQGAKKPDHFLERVDEAPDPESERQPKE